MTSYFLFWPSTSLFLLLLSSSPVTQQASPSPLVSRSVRSPLAAWGYPTCTLLFIFFLSDYSFFVFILSQLCDQSWEFLQAGASSHIFTTHRWRIHPVNSPGPSLLSSSSSAEGRLRRKGRVPVIVTYHFYWASIMCQAPHSCFLAWSHLMLITTPSLHMWKLRLRGANWNAQSHS